MATGTAGAGYTHDVQISIRGGGGRNGRAIGKVVNGKIDKILITSGGLLYTSPTFAKIHPGGWRSISRGNAPLNDTLIPAGSGLLIERTSSWCILHAPSSSICQSKRKLILAHLMGIHIEDIEHLIINRKLVTELLDLIQTFTY